jgi:hypothetical protein
VSHYFSIDLLLRKWEAESGKKKKQDAANNIIHTAYSKQELEAQATESSNVKGMFAEWLQK